jgi:2-haloalkanoic acid dehalogenase type II
MDRWVTFDCYGTLIDWERGIGDSLARLWPQADRDRLLARYHEFEPQVQAGTALPYREVMAQALEKVAGAEGLELRQFDREALAESLPSWPPFPEVGGSLTEIARQGWRIGILSNTDPDLLAASLILIGVAPDVVITAAEAGSYKPALGHWEAFRERTGADPAGHVHVGASLFHDIEPANELGLPVVWINRLGETSDMPRAAELPDLRDLPRTLDEVVPSA